MSLDVGAFSSIHWCWHQQGKKKLFYCYASGKENLCWCRNSTTPWKAVKQPYSNAKRCFEKWHNWNPLIFIEHSFLPAEQDSDSKLFSRESTNLHFFFKLEVLWDFHSAGIWQSFMGFVWTMVHHRKIHTQKNLNSTKLNTHHQEIK